MEERLQALRDRADFAVTDLIAVDGDDRRYLGGGAAGKDLVGKVELGPVDWPLDHIDAELLPHQGDQGIAGDALEDTAGDVRGNQRAIAQEHDTGSRRLGDLSLRVEHERDVVAVLADLHSRQLPVAVIREVLDPWWHDAIGNTCP